MRVQKNSTDVSVYFKIPAGLTVTDFDTQYTREQTDPSTKADVTALADPDSAHADNKGIYVDATTSPGLFRLDVPDAAVATGVNYVYVTLLYEAGKQETVRVELTDAPLTAADVNAEVLDVMNVDTHGEPGQGAPAATLSIFAKINYLFKAWRNLKKQTASGWELYDDAGATVDQKCTDSDDGATATRGEIVSGP